ncbi:hypothetical protein JRQ81_011171 [Phrynocephalus forsythii]|uniref:Uncharacterized protein n=1 Tax=Phrynocephalus forsythii TaxID=171643 RepID=A0A9Q0X7K7_9SAUR|nr:hypothetical protein JRQ81_011171 [Phrynocephalus forsythii]
MDSVPSEPPPCSAENKVVASGPHSFSAAASVAECAPSTQEARGPSGSPSRKAVEEGTRVPEEHMKTTGPPGKGNQMPTVGSPESPSEGKNQEAFAAPTGKRPHETTQSRETEMPSIGSAVKKASVALQSLPVDQGSWRARLQALGRPSSHLAKVPQKQG